MIVAIDRAALEELATRASSGMIAPEAIGRELVTLMESGSTLFDDMVGELRGYGCCHRPLHPPKEQVGKPCQCRWCRIMRAVG